MDVFQKVQDSYTSVSVLGVHVNVGEDNAENKCVRFSKIESFYLGALTYLVDHSCFRQIKHTHTHTLKFLKTQKQNKKLKRKSVQVNNQYI